MAEKMSVRDDSILTIAYVEYEKVVKCKGNLGEDFQRPRRVIQHTISTGHGHALDTSERKETWQRRNGGRTIQGGYAVLRSEYSYIKYTPDSQVKSGERR